MANDVRDHEIEILSYGKQKESLGTAWWNGKKVEASSGSLLSFLKDTIVTQGGNKLKIEDGIGFLDALPDYLDSYICARKVTK